MQLKFKRLSVISLLVSISFSAGVSKSAILKQLLNDQQLAVVQTIPGETLLVGDLLIVSAGSKQCLLKIVSVRDRLATVSSADCSDRSTLSVGASAEKSLIDPAAINSENFKSISQLQQVPAPLAEEPRIAVAENHFRNYGALFLGFVNSPKIKMEGRASSTSGSERGSLEWDIDSTLKIGYEWSQFNQASWNHGFTVDYSNLKFNTARSKGASGESSFDVSDTMSLLSVGYSGKYLWKQFYLPAALGLGGSSINSSALFTKTLATSSYVAVGTGINVSEKVNLELSFFSYVVTGKTITSNGLTLIPDAGHLQFYQLSAKFLLF